MPYALAIRLTNLCTAADWLLATAAVLAASLRSCRAALEGSSRRSRTSAGWG